MCVCVCVWGYEACILEAVHIISAKHSVLAGRQGERTINITWYSRRCDYWRIHGLMDAQTTTVIELLSWRSVFVCVCFFFVFFCIRSRSQNTNTFSFKLPCRVFTFLGAFPNVWAHLCLLKSVAFEVRDIGSVLQECAICNAVYPQTS